ncbi:MAG: glucose-6-phosphate isomerase family protein [Methanolobus sp.]
MGKELDFHGNIHDPDIRMLHDMDEVVRDQEWLRSQDNFELYYMYRDLSANKSDYEKIVEKRLRYDVTIIPPAMLADEYVKTAGHYHPPVPARMSPMQSCTRSLKARLNTFCRKLRVTKLLM